MKMTANSISKFQLSNEYHWLENQQAGWILRRDLSLNTGKLRTLWNPIFHILMKSETMSHENSSNALLLISRYLKEALMSRLNAQQFFNYQSVSFILRRVLADTRRLLFLSYGRTFSLFEIFPLSLFLGTHFKLLTM